VQYAGALEASGGHAEGCKAEEEEEDDDLHGWCILGVLYMQSTMHCIALYL
jgi:hypothetical protein